MKIKLSKKLCVGMTTFLRDNSMHIAVKSIMEYYPNLKIYIIDQGVKTPEKKSFYKHLRKLGHYTEFVEYDSGISKCRNILHSRIKEPYMAYVQDDFIVNEKTNFYNMLKILENNPDIGVVGGQVIDYPQNKKIRGEYFFCRTDKNMIYIPCDWLLQMNLMCWQDTSDIKYHYTDIVSDFTMWRKSLKNIFDNDVKIVEHSHTYLKIRFETNWKVAFTPSSQIFHTHDRTGTEYCSKRTRKDDIPYVLKYWNIKGITRLNNVKFKNLTQETEEITPVQSTHIMNDTKNTRTEVLIALNKIKKQNLNFWLLGNTCLNAIRTKKINNDVLYIGVRDCATKDIITKIMEDITVQCNITIENRSKIKPIHCYDMVLYVPSPVISYLEKTFNKPWRILINE